MDSQLEAKVWVKSCYLQGVTLWKPRISLSLVSTSVNMGCSQYLPQKFVVNKKWESMYEGTFKTVTALWKCQVFKNYYLLL